MTSNSIQELFSTAVNFEALLRLYFGSIRHCSPLMGRNFACRLVHTEGRSSGFTGCSNTVRPNHAGIPFLSDLLVV